MGRLLDFLSRQPTPWLQKMQLDAQPSQPLLQKIFSRLPERQAGERYAFSIAPHAFLAQQPAHPLLDAVQLWRHPLISNICWLSRPPLAGLASPSASLLGEMNSQRVPGAVASVLVLVFCLAYLLNHEDVSPVDSPLGGEDSAATEAQATSLAATDGADPQPSESTTAEPAASAGSTGTPTVEEFLADASGSHEVAPASAQDALTPSAAADPEALQAKTSADEPRTGPAESEAASGEKTVSPTDESADGDSAAQTGTSTEQSAQTAEEPHTAKPAPDTKAAETDTTTDESAGQKAPATATQASATTEQPQADEKVVAAPAKSETKQDTAPAQPVYFNKQRSLAILTEARYLYLGGEGPLAVERLGLALSSGHIHPDHGPAFARMETDIQSLLESFESAQTAADEETVRQFLALEDEVFPGKVSAYEEQLSAPDAEARVAEEAPTSDTPYRGLQPPEPEENRPH